MNILNYLKDINILSIFFRILLSTVIGGLIGMERGRHGRAAGLRTYILVSVGSCIATFSGMIMVMEYGNGDPSRIASGVVSGIGFLGAGMIMVRSSRITGLTTAAALWACGTVGIAVGAGIYSAAIIGTLVILITTSTFSKLEYNQRENIRFYIEITDETKLNYIFDTIRETYPNTNSFEVHTARSGITGNIGANFNILLMKEDKSEIMTFLRNLDSVVFAIEN